MNEVIRFALLGLGVGALYAFASQGLIVIYRGTGVLNFSLGATAIAGVFMQWELHERARLAVPGVGGRRRRLVGVPRDAHPLGDHAAVAPGELAGAGDRHARRADHVPGSGRAPVRLEPASGRELAAD